MRRTRSAAMAFLCLAAALLGGCSTMMYRTPAANDAGVEHLTAASLRQKHTSYEVKGLVHCERWSCSLYWQSRPELLGQVMDEFNGQVALLGANAVVDVQTKVENHYQFAAVIFSIPVVFGHEEVHVSGTAIKLSP